MNTTEILEKTQKLVSNDRAKKHGDKVSTHENIARLWSSYLQNKTKLNITILFAVASSYNIKRHGVALGSN